MPPDENELASSASKRSASVEWARGVGVSPGAVRRRGGMPVLVLLTDGRANVSRDGCAGRTRAEEDALAAARLVRVSGVRAILIDTSPRSQAIAQRLATEMGATYLPLPYANAPVLSAAVQAATASTTASRGSS